MIQSTNSGSSASLEKLNTENPFDSIKKLSDVFELETDFCMYVAFETTDMLLSDLVWLPDDLKLTDYCKEVYADALNCPACIEDDLLIISADTEQLADAVAEFLFILAGDCSSSVYSQMVISQAQMKNDGVI